MRGRGKRSECGRSSCFALLACDKTIKAAERDLDVCEEIESKV